MRIICTFSGAWFHARRREPTFVPWSALRAGPQQGRYRIDDAFRFRNPQLPRTLWCCTNQANVISRHMRRRTRNLFRRGELSLEGKISRMPSVQLLCGIAMFFFPIVQISVRLALDGTSFPQRLLEHAELSWPLAALDLIALAILSVGLSLMPLGFWWLMRREHRWSRRNPTARRWQADAESFRVLHADGRVSRYEWSWLQPPVVPSRIFLRPDGARDFILCGPPSAITGQDTPRTLHDLVRHVIMRRLGIAEFPRKPPSMTCFVVVACLIVGVMAFDRLLCIWLGAHVDVPDHQWRASLVMGTVILAMWTADALGARSTRRLPPRLRRGVRRNLT